MSYADGWAAVNLEMPERIPRFDPSAPSYHWDLVNAVCGTALSVDSPNEERLEGSRAFIKAWDYGIFFGCLIGGGELSAKRTSMGTRSTHNVAATTTTESTARSRAWRRC